MFREGFMMLNTTGTVRQLTDGDFEKQLDRIEEAVADLVDNNCDSIIFSGSPLFTRLPFGSDRELGKKLTEKFGVPVAAGLTAEVESLKAMNCKKTRRRHALRRRDQPTAQAPFGSQRLRSLADRWLRRA
jgi:maleate cis-trans isomerase